MSDFGAWTGMVEPAARDLREQRCGLPGLGGRPALHPAWREPDDAGHRVAAGLSSATTSPSRGPAALPR